eukprot:COSAG01_NODE_1351_length_10617_cov_4.243392_5_plen_423_part_00
MEPDEGFALARTMTGHGTRYDELLAQGMPRKMLRHAWVATGGDAAEAERFVHDNFDQPDEFWQSVPPFGADGDPDAGDRRGERAELRQHGRQPQQQASAAGTGEHMAALERAHELLSTLPPEQLQESGVVLAELEATIARIATPPSPPSQPLPAGGASTVAVARAATSLLPIVHGANSAPPPPPPPPALPWEQEFAATEAARAEHSKSGEHFLCGLQRGDWVDVNIGGLCCQLVAAAAPALPPEAAGTQPPPPPPPQQQAAREERWVVAQVVSVALDVPTPLGHLMRDCTLLVPDAGHQRRYRGRGHFRCVRCNMLGPSRETGQTACVHCRLCSVCCGLAGARGQRCEGGKGRRADLCADRDSSGRDPQSSEPEPEPERELEPEPESEPEAGLMTEGVPMQPRAARVMLNIGKAHRGGGIPG